MATITRENIGLLNDKITVKVAKEDYLSSFEKSLKNYSKNANIPGFRKGMVPPGMIKKMHGQSVFTDEVLKTVEKELSNYMANEKLEIFAQPLPLPEEDIRKIDMNQPADYAFGFEVGLKPEFNLPDVSKEKVERYKVIVTNEMIDQEIERLLMRHGKMTEPESIAGEENVLNLTFIESDQDGNEMDGSIKKDNSLLVKYFTPDVRNQIMGKKKDDSLVIQLSKAFEGKEKEWILNDLGISGAADAADKFFKILITKVGYIEKAALDEAFFKTAYPGKEINNEEDLRSILKEEIQSYWDNQSHNHLQHEIYHALVEHTDIRVPETFLKRWMQQSGEQQKSAEEVEDEFPTFANQLKWTLITEKLVKENKIEVGPDDIRTFAKQQLFGYMGMTSSEEEQPWISEYVSRMMKDKKFVEDAYHRIQADKVFRWLEENVHPVEKPISVEDFNKLLQEHQHHHH